MPNKTNISNQKKLNPVMIKGNRYFFNYDDSDTLIPNLIEVQLESYNWFLKEGIQELIDEISPIVDYSGKKYELRILNYAFDPSKYTPNEAKRKNLDYEIYIKSHAQLINKETGEVKEQDIYLSSLPKMTERGSFVINGIERVIVNQIVRSPGAFFGKNSDNDYFSSKIIPKRGAWLEIETDKNGILWVKIDRKRKIVLTTLLRIFLAWQKEQQTKSDKKVEITDNDIIKEFKDVKFTDGEDNILLTLNKDHSKNVDEAYEYIYKKLRPGDMATIENAKAMINAMFFDYKKYDFGKVARYKINRKFNLDKKYSKKNAVFQVDDFMIIVRHLIKLNNNIGRCDDIDHLANRRIKSVGELLQQRMRIGLLRMERIIKDRMSVIESEAITPNQLINNRPVIASIREFFMSSQLSQFMDQTNPLAELEHKRRLSAMGPGGLVRERAGFEVRDVHTSHYGRICPIESPEGPNIGLVVHMALFTKVNEYGFLETPYVVVKQKCKNTEKDLLNKIAKYDIIDPKTKKIIVKEKECITKELAKKITKSIKDKEIEVRAYIDNEILYFDALQEEKFIIAQANSQLDKYNNFVNTRIVARKYSDPVEVHVNEITHMDLSPKQILSVAAGHIPFIEHDYSTRALMASNMQRQAVPVIQPKAPIVGTGVERVAARNSGYLIIAENDGEVLYVDALKMEVMYKNGKKAVYDFIIYERSNQSTVTLQKPILNKGDKFKKGDVLADGPGIENGEMALGQNLIVAYMPWYGYNYEDAIILSEKVVSEHLYTSVHIEDYIIDIRDTKLGPELITRDIPNVSESKLKNLDKNGVIRIGALVKEGDILVGKITPKGETETTAEDRLLQAIYGEKSKEVRDSSLKMPGGEAGKVIDINILSRENSDELPSGVIKQIKVYVATTRRIEIGDKLAGRHGNKGVISNIVPIEDMPFMEDGTPVDLILNPLGVISRTNVGQIMEAHLGWACKKLGINIGTPPINGVSSDFITDFLIKADLPSDGKAQLYDGKTGEPLKYRTTVGIAYILKLHHLVEEKIHARSVGPYSLITQQPLGGKAQHGGQRFGEMEVWALEAYGAAYTLQEMLTIKSDDVIGRSKTYESIVKDEGIKITNIPESFYVLLRELQALGLKVELQAKNEEIEDIEQEITDSIQEDDNIPDANQISELESIQ